MDANILPYPFTTGTSVIELLSAKGALTDACGDVQFMLLSLTGEKIPECHFKW